MIKNKYIPYCLITVLVLMVFAARSFAAESVDHRDRVTNGTASKITITYFYCITFEKQKLCSDDKSDTIFPGETKYYADHPEATYEIKKITNGVYVRNLGIAEDIKNHPIDEKKMPKCKISDSIIITQYFTSYFCERGGA